MSRFPHIVFFSLFLVPTKRKKEWRRGGESEGGERGERGEREIEIGILRKVSHYDVIFARHWSI